MRAPLLAMVLLSVSCIDPTHVDAVNALGGEVNGVGPGPRHRPGQPCLTCHGGDGPGPDFVTAGTVYQARGSTTALSGAMVTLTDARGMKLLLETNEVGNFYQPTGSWDPTFPLHVEIAYGGTTKPMDTRIGRNAGCGECHRGNGDAAHAPAVYLTGDP